MDYSILVVSCDKNLGLLDCFFKFFKLHFGKTEEIYLSLENKDYKYPGLNITTIKGGNTDWSSRVKKALKILNTDSVLLLLDDFIIEKTVDLKELQKLAHILKNSNDIAMFALTTVPMKNASNQIYFDRYFERAKFGRYKVTLQAGMWKKSVLQSLLKNGENAWEVEVFANIRSYPMKTKFYAVSSKKLKPIVYNEGLFCVQGKQNEKEIIRLSKKFGEDLHIDGMPSNHGVLIRDETPFKKKIIRRISITIYQAKYYILTFLKRG